MKKLWSLVAMLFVLCGCGLLRAQSYDMTAQTGPFADLSKATWRFHTGDDPRWADPGFDDSLWPLLAGDKSWDAQGYKLYSGIAWYRIHIKVPPGEALSIAPGNLHDSYEVYADGREIGHWGSLSRDAWPLSSHGAWTLVAPVPRHSGEIVLAIRVWHWPRWAVYYGGGFTGAPVLLGNPVAVSDWVELRKHENFLARSPVYLTALLGLLAGLGTLLLYAKERSSKEYLWFGFLEVATGLGHFFGISVSYLIGMSVFPRDSVIDALSEIAIVAMILFLFRFIDRPVTRWVRWFLLAQIPLFFFKELAGYTSVLNIGQWDSILMLNYLLAYLIELWLVFRYWTQSRAARRLAIPVLLLVLVSVVPGVYFLLFGIGWVTWTTHLIPTGNFTFIYAWVAQLIFLAAMAYLLIERFAETQAERTRLHGEFEAARGVQQVLIPDFLPQVPGLHVESAYFPAQQVGGDFFQVLPIPGGGDAFIVVGDVSGKGLKAAMTVSLLVGALRTLSEYVVSPAELLAGLNRRLHGRDAGLATCLVLKITPQGDVTLANAGHPNPYLDGVEVQTENNLPLGATLDIAYAESQFHLGPTQHLTLVTDGVVEATAHATRELFGFDRTQAISQQAANAIAETARAFGLGAPQADDITVLTVART